MATLLSTKLQHVWTLPSIGGNWHKLEQWLGFQEVISRQWVKRFPAVIGASSFLAIFVSSSGIQTGGLLFVSVTAVLGLALILIVGRSVQW